MLDKELLLLYVAVFSAASGLHQVPVFYGPSTPVPIQYAPVANPISPAIITYSGFPTGSQPGTVEAYKTVTAHPPPSAYETSPSKTPYVPTLVDSVPNNVAAPVGYAPPVVPGIASYPGAGFQTAPLPFPTYSPIPVPGNVPASPYPTVRSSNKYPGSSKLFQPDSFGEYTLKSEDSDSNPATSPRPTYSPKSIPVPVEYPTLSGIKVGPALVYAPVENAVAYKKPSFTPVATYALQSAYANANYAKASAYSPANAVSRVIFDGLGVSYQY